MEILSKLKNKLKKTIFFASVWYILFQKVQCNIFYHFIHHIKYKWNILWTHNVWNEKCIIFLREFWENDNGFGWIFGIRDINRNEFSKKNSRVSEKKYRISIYEWKFMILRSINHCTYRTILLNVLCYPVLL